MQANWPTRIDAITDALNELYKSYPIPNTGNLATDLDDYLHQLTGVVTNARARQVLGALIAEGASNPALAAALRARVVEPRRATLAARLADEPDHLTVSIPAAVDILTGPIFERALLSETPPDDDLVGAIIGVLLTAPTEQSEP